MADQIYEGHSRSGDIVWHLKKFFVEVPEISWLHSQTLYLDGTEVWKLHSRGRPMSDFIQAFNSEFEVWFFQFCSFVFVEVRCSINSVIYIFLIQLKSELILMAIDFNVDCAINLYSTK